MRIRMLLMFLLCGTGLCKAQFETGKKVIGMQLDLYANHGTNVFTSPGLDNRSDLFAVSFSLSRFKSPTLLRGFGINYSHNEYDYDMGNTTNGQKNYSHNIGVFVSSMRLQPLAGKLYFTYTGTAGADYSFAKNDYLSNTSSMQLKGYNVHLSAGLGLLYQLHPRFLLTTDLSNLVRIAYGHADMKTTYPTSPPSYGKSDNIVLSTGLNGFSLSSIAVGVRYMVK